MARKRLSDLLREEVKKPTEGAAATVPDPTAGVANGVQKTAPTEQTDVEQRSAESGKPAEDLAAELAVAQQREQELQQQLADLQAQLKQQAASEKKLQASLDKTEKHNQQLAAELAEAKQTILQLAENNAQLKQELETLQSTPKAAPSTKPPAIAKSEPKPSLPATRDQSAQPLTQQEILRRRQADSLAHPVFPIGKSPGQVSDQEIGWFD